MRFRMRHHRPEAAPAAPVATAERPAPEWLPAEASAPEPAAAAPALAVLEPPAAPAPPAAVVPEPAPAPAHAPVPPSIASRLAGSPMRSQLSGGDVRAERMVKQIRGEVEDLRGTLAASAPAPATSRRSISMPSSRAARPRRCCRNVFRLPRKFLRPKDADAEACPPRQKRWLYID